MRTENTLANVTLLHEFPLGFPMLVVNNMLANAGDAGSIPEEGRHFQKRKWQPTPAFLPRKSHGQRSLAGYSPWGGKRVRHDLATEQQVSTTLL